MARDVRPVLGFMGLRGRCWASWVCAAGAGRAGADPGRYLLDELAAAGFWALAVLSTGVTWWFPLVLLSLPSAVRLLAPSVRGAGPHWLLTAPLLPASRAALGGPASLGAVCMRREPQRDDLSLVCGAPQETLMIFCHSPPVIAPTRGEGRRNWRRP